MGIQPLTDKESLCLGFWCDYCKHRGNDRGKKYCQIRAAMLTAPKKRTDAQQFMIDNQVSDEGCKSFETSDKTKPAPLPKDRDVSRVVRKHGK